MLGPRVVIPETMKFKILEELHKCHAGLVRTKAKARTYIYWPRLNEDIEEMARGCHKCQEWANTPPETLTMPTSWPDKPWQQLNIDLAGPVAGKMLLVVVDRHNKWLEVNILRGTDTASIITELRKILNFCRCGASL